MQSLIKQASLQTTDHACGPYAELTAFVSNSWIGFENLNNFVLHYKKCTMLDNAKPYILRIYSEKLLNLYQTDSGWMQSW